MNYTAGVRSAAAEGKLEAVTGLFPSELVEGVLDFEKDVGDMGSQTVNINGEDQTAGKESGRALQLVNTVSFVGGDHAYQFTEATGTEASSQQTQASEWETFAGPALELGIAVSGVGKLAVSNKGMA